MNTQDLGKWIGLAMAGLLALCAASTTQASPAERARWQHQAQAVTITRDDWGIAHVHGKTDADAVFGMAYAQAEDDFNRVETNYLVSLGRLSEARHAGDAALWQDLRQRLFIDPVDAEAAVRAESSLAARIDGQLGGWTELLPGHPSRCASARDHPLRTVDGTVLHRRQHRWRHRADST